MDQLRETVLAGHRGDEAAARAALTATDPGVRAAALSALARIGTLGATDFRAAASDGDPGVRRRVAQLAPRALGGEALPVDDLIELLGDPEWTVAEAAAAALGEIEPPGPDEDRDEDGDEDRVGDVGRTARAVEALTATATTHEDPICREAAVAALGSIGAEAGLEAVLAGCEDRANVRRRAVLALAAFEDPRASAALRRMVEDRDLQVSQAAEDLLAIEDGEVT